MDIFIDEQIYYDLKYYEDVYVKETNTIYTN